MGGADGKVLTAPVPVPLPHASCITRCPLRDGTKPADLTGIASSETMARVTREGDYKTWTEKFLT